jgi:RNA polymerase sigma-70 factor (ECF subfamily)
MARDVTFTALARVEPIDAASTEFVMDEETFRGFYERTARGVWAYLARITNDRQMADDLLQEAYYRFLRAAAMHDSEEHRRNSLYRIATNLAKDARRRQSVRPVAAVAGDEIERVASVNSPAPNDSSTDLNRAMAHLKPQERAMLWLAYAEGASHREIAAALSLGEGSVKTLLSRARKKLAILVRRPHVR